MTTENINELSISKLIILGQNGREDAILCLLKKFAPLIKKYAKLLFIYEYDDAIQEMTLALYLAITKIKNISNDAYCIVYIKKSIINRYIYLKKLKSEQLYMELFNFDFEYAISHNNPYSDIIFKTDMIKHTYFKSNIQKSIIFCVIFFQLSDSETAKLLNVSRQYINREKKKIFKNLNYT